MEIPARAFFFKKESEEAIVFYGDKLIPSDLLNYKKIIIDKENVVDDIQPKMVLRQSKDKKDSKPA